jgi:hypothetical protein
MPMSMYDYTCSCAQGFEGANCERPSGSSPVPTCPPGSRAVEAKGCVECAVGTYQPMSGQGSCLPCPPGSIASGTGWTTCTECPARTYSTVSLIGVAIGCEFCPPGMFSLGAVTSCTQCPVGQAERLAVGQGRLMQRWQCAEGDGH